MIQIDKALLDDLFAKAKVSDRKRMNYDLRTSPDDKSQRMLNALLPGTSVPVHRHPRSNENVICLKGRLVEIVFEEVTSYDNDDDNDNTSTSSAQAFPMAMESGDVVKRTRLVEKERIMLDPSVGNFGCVVPAGAWHTVEVLEPSVIYEAKDGKYGEDGSEAASTKTKTESKNVESTFSNSLGDMKKNIEHLIGMERQSGSMEVITPLYVSRMLYVPLEDVERCMKEMGM